MTDHFDNNGDPVLFEDDAYFEELANSKFAVNGTDHQPQTDTDNGIWGQYAMNGKDLLQLHIDPMEWVVDGIIPEGLTMLAAPPKMGKSWFVLDIALAVASGGKALSGIDVGPARPVLHLSLEDSNRRLRQRISQLMGDDDIPELWWRILDIDPGKTIEVIADFLGQFRGQRPLVIVDVFTKAAAVPADKAEGYKADYRMMDPWKRLVGDHPGAGILLVHHTRKMAADDYLETVSGSNGIAGSCDTIMVLSRERDSSDGTLYVTGRDTEEAAYKLKFGNGWTLDGNSLQAAREAAWKAEQRGKTSGDGQKVLDAVMEAGEPIGPKAIAAITGVADKAVSSHLTRLARAGQVMRAGRGLYSIVEPDGMGLVG